MEKLSVNELNPTPYIKLAAFVIGTMFIVFFIWGAFAPLKSAAVASGKLIVSGQNKVVQHLYGGVVKEILVEDGDSVKKGETLLILDDIQAKSRYVVFLKNKYELIAKISRLNSIIDGRKDILFDSSLKSIEDKDYQAKLFNSQKAIFSTQKKLLLTQDAIIRKKIQSLKDEISGTKKSLSSKKQYLLSIEEEIGEWTELYKQKLVSKVNLRDLKRKKMTLQSDMTNYTTSLSKLEIQILELQEQSLLQKREFLNKVVSQLSEARAQLSEVEENIVAAKDIVDKSVLKASNSGVVQNLVVFTKGGVIQAGEPIMSIVPKNRALIIEAKLDTTDIDQVRSGMKCDILLVSFDTQNNFVIEGEVKYVSQDSTVDQATNIPYYSVHIDFTPNGKQQIKANKLTLQTGMPAEAMIQTGSRTLLSYIVQPFNDIARRAFNED